MKRILLVPVTFNSYSYLDSFLKSVKQALLEVGENIDLEIHIADNSTEKKDFDLEKYGFRSISWLPLNNLGYFGGAFKIINENVAVSDYDYVIISNVDLTISKDFFANLLNVPIPENIGWIAPRIFSEIENRDKNPQRLTRPSKKRLEILKSMYKYPFLSYIYSRTLYKRKKYVQKPDIENIYSGHGSFIILTHEFFKHYPHIEYPVFLFGEEVFLGELCRKAGLKVIYNPTIEIFDCEHVSTSKMKSSFYYECNYKALTYLLSEFYS